MKKIKPIAYAIAVSLCLGTISSWADDDERDRTHSSDRYSGGSHDGDSSDRGGDSGGDSGSTGSQLGDVVVIGTNDLGMHCACPGSEYFMLLPPFNTLRAQVIRRGEEPDVLDDPNQIRVEYNIVENTDASLQADPYFAKWMEMQPKYGFGSALNADGKIQGLTGATLDGEMEAKEGEGWWEVVGIPAFPDASSNSSAAEKVMIDPLGGPDRNPYLTANIKVFDQQTDALLAETNTVAPVAFGGCCGCHLQVTENTENPDTGQPYEATPENSFKVMGALHNRDAGIDIAKLDPDSDGQPGPVRCSVCHWDPAMGESQAPGGYKDPTTGDPLPVSEYSFSDVLHRWHAENSTVLDYDPNLATSCYNCHPGNGVNCYRGHHGTRTGEGGAGSNGEIWCTDCHGDLHQRAAEGQLDNPWSDQTLPVCKDCHSERTGEGSSSGYLNMGIFGQYLNSRSHEDNKILCSTCHGEPHALYPSTLAKDNEQMISLQGEAGPLERCTVCHTSGEHGNPHNPD